MPLSSKVDEEEVVIALTKAEEMIKVGIVGAKGVGKKSFVIDWVAIERNNHTAKRSNSTSLTVHGSRYGVQFMLIEPKFAKNITESAEELAVADGYIFCVGVENYDSLHAAKAIHSMLCRHYSNQYPTQQEPQPVKGMVPITQSQIGAFTEKEKEKKKKGRSLLSLLKSNADEDDMDELAASSRDIKVKFGQDTSPSSPTPFKCQFPKLFAGTKCDTKEQDREVSVKTMMKMADECATHYMETSSLTHIGLDVAVEEIVKKVIAARKQKLLKEIGASVSNTKPIRSILSSADEEDDFVDNLRARQKK